MNPMCSALLQRFRFVLLLFAIGFTGSSTFSAEEEWVYAVRPGDTLVGIAERYFVNPQTWPQVQSRNKLADPHRIPDGTRLSIPARLLRIDPVVVEVLMVNGQAGIVKGGGEESKALSAGDSLRAGDEVRVAASSNLSLRFPDGSRLLVLGKSRFKLQRAAHVHGADMSRVQIDLSEGNIESSVTPAPGGTRQFEIRTPALRMSVRGTKFRAASDGFDGQSRSEVVSGRVKVSGTHRSLILGAGFGWYAALGQPPQAPRRLVAAPGFAGLPTLYERLPLRFAWNPVPTAQGYRAQVLDSSANLVLDGVFQDSAARWADLPDGRYTLRVRGISGNRLEGFDAEHDFTLDARPEPPFGREPMSKAYGQPTRFEWTEAVDSATYHFQLASDGAFKQVLVDEPALSSGQFTRELAPGHYFWRVATVDARGDHGPFGDVVAFEQRPVPASPQAEAPEVGDEQLSFRWPAGEPGQHYQMQLAKTPDFAQLLSDQTTDNAAITLPRPEAGDYFMRVRAIEADGFIGPFGATQRFTVPGVSAWWLLLLLLPVVL